MLELGRNPERGARPPNDDVHHPLRHVRPGRAPGRQGPHRHGRRADHRRAAAPWRREPSRPTRDAVCMAGARAAGARIVGRTNLHELALGVTGVNPWYGTPVNPLDPTLVPGGSSSGSAVAVATGEADVAYGSDTGGSVRIPAACCGTAGLKTTWGRIPLGGVWPLSPSFDTVGPMARDVAGLVLGMQLLEPGFTVAAPDAGAERGSPPHRRRARHHRRHRPGATPRRVGVPRAARARLGRGDDPGRPAAGRRGVAFRHCARGRRTRTASATTCASGCCSGSTFDDATVRAAWLAQRDWQATLERVFTEVDFLVTPTLTIFPPHPRGGRRPPGRPAARSRSTWPASPPCRLPVPTDGPLPPASS